MNPGDGGKATGSVDGLQPGDGEGVPSPTRRENQRDSRAISGRMTLEEALQVKWLRSRPKPLGALLAEGYLDSARLQWAAQWAYSARLKEAARVILDWQAGRAGADAASSHVLTRRAEAAPRFEVGISLEDARSTPWPFGPLKGQPMGVLSATGALSLKDLAHAIESAWDERVRKAAIALTLDRLNQALKEPPPPAGPLNVVAAGRSFAGWSQLRLAFIEGAFMGLLLGLVLAYVVSSLLRPDRPAAARLTLADILVSRELLIPYGLGIIAVAALVALAWLLIGLVIKRLDAAIEAYRRGEEGEERVVDKARRALDGRWTLFRNVVIPGRRKADIDIVLVGPPGVWALEVKTLRGQYRNVGESWQLRDGSRWRRMKANPSRQARSGAIALAGFLSADGIKTYVEAAVAWADPESRLSVQDPIVPVWPLDRLEDELGNLWNGRRLGEAERQRIVEKLRRLCLSKRKGSW